MALPSLDLGLITYAPARRRRQGSSIWRSHRYPWGPCSCPITKDARWPDPPPPGPNLAREWCEQGWPNLPKGYGNSQFDGNETKINPASKQHDLKPRNRSTTSPMVINRRCVVDLAKKAKSFACELKNSSKNKEECNQFINEILISWVGVSQTDKTMKLFLTE